MNPRACGCASIEEIARYWGTDYDWRKCEAKLNALPQFITTIDGLDVHFTLAPPPRQMAPATPAPARPQPSAPVGNQALLRRLQPKLTIGAIDDPLEAEADNVADRVMRMEDPADGLAQAPPAVSRKCAACEEENKLQTKLANTPLAADGAPSAAAGAAPGITASPVKVFREDDPDVVPAGGPDAKSDLETANLTPFRARSGTNGPAIPDELLVASDKGQVLFFCGAGVSSAKAQLPGFLDLADRVLNELRALPDRSGSGVCRPGFEKLLTAICEGRVGAVVSIEASRLAQRSHCLCPDVAVRQRVQAERGRGDFI